MAKVNYFLWHMAQVQTCDDRSNAKEKVGCILIYVRTTNCLSFLNYLSGVKEKSIDRSGSSIRVCVHTTNRPTALCCGD